MPRLDPIPTHDEIYECFCVTLDEYNNSLPEWAHSFPWAHIPELYFNIKKKFRGYKIDRFHDTLVEMRQWDDYHVQLEKGIIIARMKKKDLETLHPTGRWYYIKMKKRNELK